jgi:hypothetical protein
VDDLLIALDEHNTNFKDSPLTGIDFKEVVAVRARCEFQVSII